MGGGKTMRERQTQETDEKGQLWKKKYIGLT
jgi:hypothetical protein